MTLQQMVYDLRRRVDQLEQELADNRAATDGERLRPEPPPSHLEPPGGERAEIVLRAVQHVFGVTPAALRSASCPDSIMPARKAAAKLLFEHHFSNREVGRILGDRSSSNAGYLRRQAADLPTHLLDSARQRALELTR